MNDVTSVSVALRPRAIARLGARYAGRVEGDL